MINAKIINMVSFLQYRNMSLNYFSNYSELKMPIQNDKNVYMKI